MRSHLTVPLLAAALLAFSAPDSDAATMTLQARTSVNYLYYFGGFAVSADEGEDGAPAPLPGGAWEGTVLTGFDMPQLAIQGMDHHNIQYLGWLGHLDETWDQAQSFSFTQGLAGAELHIDGHAAITQTSEVCSMGSGCFLASELHRSTNTVALEFTLDAANPYTLTGSTSGGQYVDLQRWDVLSQRWFPVVFGAFDTINTTFALSGTLNPGLYRLQNDPYTFSAGGAADVNNRFDATLTLTGAVAAMVPEPGAAGLLACGLAVMALKRRRRSAD